MTTIIGALRDYILSFDRIDDDKPVWVQYLDAFPVSYSVMPMAGQRVIKEYLSGSSLREYSFAFRTAMSTADDLERLENLGFYEEFADWVEMKSRTGELPDLGPGKEAVEMETTGWGYLFEEGVSDTGIYQIQCRLEYYQAKE